MHHLRVQAVATVGLRAVGGPATTGASDPVRPQNPPHRSVTTVALCRHLGRRFVGALWPGGPSRLDEAWVASVLGPGELDLWRRMSGSDRRHAVGVARRVSVALGPQAARPVLGAALLHDVGKLTAGLGTLARVPATVVGMVGGRARASGWAGRRRGVRRRLGLYLRHAPVGASLLEAGGADPLTCAWAAEHHLDPSAWTLPAAIAGALKAADDD